MQIQKRKKRKLSDMKGMYFFGNDFASLCVRVGVSALKTPPPHPCLVFCGRDSSEVLWPWTKTRVRKNTTLFTL